MNGFEKTYYVIMYSTGHLVGFGSPKLYQKKGQAENLAKRWSGTVIPVRLTNVSVLRSSPT